MKIILFRTLYAEGRGRGNGRKIGYTPSRGGFQPARGGYNNSETANQQSSSNYSRGNPNRGQSQVQRGTQRSSASQKYNYIEESIQTSLLSIQIDKYETFPTEFRL